MVYQKENGGEEGLFYFDKKEKGVEQEDDTIQLACDLLRSSVPRQNLWAARTIRNILQSDLNHYLESRINGQAFAEGQVRKYPVTLPVSLRCLLGLGAVLFALSLLLSCCFVTNSSSGNSKLLTYFHNNL